MVALEAVEAILADNEVGKLGVESKASRESKRF